MHYSNFLRWTLIGGLCLVFFIPFIIADGTFLFQNMFFPFITGKNFAFRILVEVLFGIYVLLALREPKYRPRASLVMWALTALVVWAGVATIFSVDSAKSFWSNFERMEGYITILHLFAYFILVSTVIVVERWWDKFFKVSILSATIMGCYAMLQLAGKIAISTQSGSRVDTTFGNATYLAIFMLFNIFITLFMLVRERRSSLAQVLYGVALALQLATLFYTQTRGSLLGVIGGLVVIAAYIAWRATGAEWRVLRKISWYALGAIAILVPTFIAFRNTELIQNSPLQRLASISPTDRTTTARFQIWNMALEGAKDRPIVGWGQENFNFVFNKYYQAPMYTQEQWFDRAHNQFLDWLIVAGLPAFLLYISLFLLAAWAVIRAETLAVPEQAVLLGLLAGYGFNNLFVFHDLMSSVYFFLILAFAHGLSRRAVPGWMILSRPASEHMVAIAVPIVAVITLVGAWSLNAPGIARAQNLLNAIMTQKAEVNASGQTVGVQKDPKENIVDFKTSLSSPVWPGTPLGRQEVFEQLMQYSTGVAASASVDPATKQDMFTLAQSVAVETLTQRPNDARLELFVGVFYNSFKQYPQALKYLTDALAHSPKKQQIMFEVGVAYLNSGDLKSALPVFKMAFDGAPEYNEARLLYAAALFYNNDTAIADALLNDGFGTVLVDDPRLLQVYTNIKRFDRVVGIWQNRVKASPKDAQTHIGLAAAYFAAGNKLGAIEELQNAARLDLTLSSQIQTVITQIQNGTLK